MRPLGAMSRSSGYELSIQTSHPTNLHSAAVCLAPASCVASFSTRTHHCLELEHVGGGELFDLVLSKLQHAALGETSLRRIWGELC